MSDATQTHHMISVFDLKPGEDEAAFHAAYEAFVADLRAASLISGAGPLGWRVDDTPMDTDTQRHQRRVSILSFASRTQMDAAYAHIEARRRTASDSHLGMYRRVTDAVFLCWRQPG